MKRKVVWLLVTGLMVAALLLASCAPAVVEEKKVAPPKEKEVVAPPKEKEVVVPEKKAEMVKWTGKKFDGTVVEKMIEKPRYGGTITQVRLTDVTSWDPVIGGPGPLVGEQLIEGDWSKGPAGTGEFAWRYWTPATPQNIRPLLAESWETPDENTLIFHIRKGVHFHNKPPTNGREMTADDILFYLLRRWETPGTHTYITYPWVTHLESITAPDKWTLVFKSLPGMLGQVFEVAAFIAGTMYPPEPIEKYGNLNDWRNAIGTGPFTLADYVPASAISFKRNPNYWDKDPIHPENTLPYVDTVKQLIIVDKSTREAALRTGKVDAIFPDAVRGLGGLGWEGARSLMKTNPELKYVGFPPGGQPYIALKLWDPELPWAGYTEKDLKVRRALSMAINYQEIVDTFYGGEAVILNFPLPAIPDFADSYIPLEKQSESIQELYGYHPDKARQLLAEAGYPNGFKTEVVTQAFDVDILSIVKEYWAKIGVDLSIRVVESGAWNTLHNRKTYGDMIKSEEASGVPHKFHLVLPGKIKNPGNIDDPYINEIGQKVLDAYFDFDLRQRLINEYAPYILEKNYRILLPAPNLYTFWQPWLKGYHGETGPGWGRDYGWAIYAWVDQELKKAMGR